MPNDNSEQLKKLSAVFNFDKIVTPEDIAQVLKGILNIMNSFKKDNQSLNTETKKVVTDLLDKVISENKKTTQEVSIEVSSKVKEIKKLIKEFSKMKPKDGKDGVDGKDADEEKIVEDVLSKIKLPEYKEVVLDTPEQIANKLESLKGDNRLDASAIKNLPKLGSVGGVVSRNIYQLEDVVLGTLSNNDVLKWNSTNNRWENGAGGGGGTWGSITGTISNQTDLQTELNAKANISGALTQFIGNGNWKLFYSDGSGDITEIALGASGTFLKSNGANSAPTFDTPSGSGDVVGPASSTDNALVRFDLTTGKLIKNSVAILSDAGALSGLTLLDVDNIRIDGNTISSTDVNGDIIIAPNGTGKIQVSSLKARTSAGMSLQDSSGGDIALFGAGGGTNSTFYNSLKLDFGTASTILSLDASKNITSLSTSTYPSLTELAYVKGVTSAIQTQLDGKQASDAELTALAGLISSANKIPMFSGVGTATMIDFKDEDNMASDSATAVPSQQSVKAYVDNAVTGLLDFKGSTDASTNPNYPSASKGDAYVVSAAGKVGGASGKSVEVGDVYLAIADNAGGTEASVGTSWIVLEHNLQGALLSSNNLSDVASASTARTNLGLGTSDSPQFTGIELGNASDTTLARIAAGRVSIEGVEVATASNTLTFTNKSMSEAQITFTDITTGDVSTTKHGFAPKGDGDTTKFLNAAGAYSTPSSGGFATRVRAYKTGTQSISSAAGNVLITWDAENFDSNNDFNLTSEQFTAPAIGIYVIHVSVKISSIADQEHFQLRLYKNGTGGTLFAQKDYVTTGSTNQTVEILSLVSCTANDTLEARANAQSADTTIDANTESSYIEIYRIA